jgi:acyl dehydratase
VTGSGVPVEVGSTAPVLHRRIELVDMVAYAGATWDWHRMHYDPAFVAAKGLPAPVVDGQMFGAMLVEQLQDWLGPGASVRTLSFRFKSLVFAGDTVRCESEVVAVDDDEVSLSCRVVAVRPDGSERVAVAPAAATVRWRR